MAKLNLLLSLNSYLDTSASNSPSLNAFKWARDFQGLAVDKPESIQFSLAPGESRTLFDGTRTLLQDGTTQYQLALKSGTSNTYVLKHVGGTAPQFRTSRTSGADATTQVTVTKNANVYTFASTAGTPFALIAGSVVVGDQVSIGNLFSAGNQGTYKIIARDATSFSVENNNGTAEGPITLGSGFADQVRIFSAAGVQPGDTIAILADFSPVSQGAFEVTAVYDDRVEFYSTDSLPQETQTTDQIAIYSQAKRLVYLESDKKLSIQINNSAQGRIEPFVSGTDIKPALLLKNETAWIMSVTNDSLDTANVFFASVE